MSQFHLLKGLCAIAVVLPLISSLSAANSADYQVIARGGGGVGGRGGGEGFHGGGSGEFRGGGRGDMDHRDANYAEHRAYENRAYNRGYEQGSSANIDGDIDVGSPEFIDAQPDQYYPDQYYPSQYYPNDMDNVNSSGY